MIKLVDKDIKSHYNFIPYVLEARGKIRDVKETQGRYFKKTTPKLKF